jgi:hypothetical protein
LLLPLDFLARKAALAIAHPGHELLVHGWLCRTRPLTFVLTDGSGGQGQPRIQAASRILAAAGAPCGSIFGNYPDRHVYQAVLSGNVHFFLALADQLADEFARNRIEAVLGDAEEQAILTHDMWRAVINRAIALAECMLRRPIANYEFLLEGGPRGADESVEQDCVLSLLRNDELCAKLAAARSYRGLSHDFDLAMEDWNEESLRRECFLPVAPQRCAAVKATPIPRYELHGERKVAAGVYSQVVRYREHVLPILEALRAPCDADSLLRGAA